MKAINVSRFGGPEVLELVEEAVPVPGAGEVLVRVRAASVNPVDWKVRSGLLDALGPAPLRVGFDFSGEVGGCDVYGMWLSRTGAYAEYVVAPEDALAPKPSGLSHVQAAALPSVALTAYQALRDVQSGQRVLVHAAAGGIGHLAVQLASLAGAYVIGTARAANHAFVKELGAHEVIDYTATDFTTAVRDVDVVFDLVGGGYGKRSLEVLAPQGVLLDAVGDDAEGDPRYRRVWVQSSGTDLAAIGELVEAGKLRVHVARTFPLADAAKAHELSETGRVRGKIVLEV
ncbi:NADP-dependent oxidoreductase [Amycolatopsis sp. GM8]|uniref:NADP-dependent oxidoreductase n=1 Tax=Amycolatopsis sp. GM8 TaxID=2896530 RepID=UPI001F3582BC|nr:NADP-dependent oxidoreductase [Amycolatopsis sp. GM8]